MAFPVGWPPRVSSGMRSIRVYIADTATAAFADRAYLFVDQAGANTYTPLPYVAPGSDAAVAVPAAPSGTGQSFYDSAPSASPKPMIWSYAIRIYNDGGSNLEFSFDGTNVHGVIKAGQSELYVQRVEAGIALRGAGVAFRVEAW